MANPRQRRKAKSSTYKAVSHSKRAKRLQKKMPAIRGPKALRDAWDPSKTLRQNYLALGLQADLNPIASGGSEIKFTYVDDQVNINQPHTTSSDNAGFIASVEPSTLPKGFGRITRDSSGNVVRVDLPRDDELEHTPNREPVVDPVVTLKESELRTWVHHPETQDAEHGAAGNTIIQDLESLAAYATLRERRPSLGKRSYLQRLVDKYGDDLDKMARDRRLNPDQRTANELRRAIAKAGGFGSTVTAVAG